MTSLLKLAAEVFLQNKHNRARESEDSGLDDASRPRKTGARILPCVLRGSGFYRNDARRCVVGLAATRWSISIRFNVYVHRRSVGEVGPPYLSIAYLCRGRRADRARFVHHPPVEPVETFYPLSASRQIPIPMYTALPNVVQ